MPHSIAYGPAPMPLGFSSHSKGILSTLIYSDIFSYPLTAQEIFERSHLMDQASVNIALNELLDSGVIFLIKGFYLLHNDAALVQRRLEANALATQSIRIAQRITKTIKRFPYVRGVMLSGSISKNYMDKDSDIDYFIITAPNRLWVSRLFFILYQKLVFLNSHKYFCYNYMIDEDHLHIANKSFYTAMETVTLLPVYNYQLYIDFLQCNAWSQAFLPNYPLMEDTIHYNKRSKVQRILEPLFNGFFGEWLDRWLMKKIEAKWRKSYPPEMFSVQNLELKRYTAKAHIGGHYNKIMELYSSKKKEYELRYNIVFDERTYLITPQKTNA